MFTAILSAIAAIPKLISSIEALLAYFKKAEEEKWFAKTEEDFAPLEKGPTTTEEKQNAAKNLAADIASL